MTQPSVSVLIPCYNGLPHVVEAVRSILDQADEGVECVVVDDGSSDGSADVLEQVFGSTLRVVRRPNGGVSAARNQALAESTGELVIWFDADDLMPPGTLEHRRAAFARDSQLEFLVGQNEIFEMETGQRVLSPQPPYDRSYFTEGLLRRNLPHLNVLTFRRSALERIGAFDADPMMAEDFDLSIRAWATLRMGFIESILSHQRVGNFVSLSKRTGLVKHYRNTQRVLVKNRLLLRAYFGADSVWRDAYTEWATDFALVLLLRGRRGEAFGWAAKAIALRPSCLNARPYKYLLEALFSTGLYASVVSAAKRFQVQGRSDLASGQR